MASIVLGCDSNGGNDSKWQNTVAKALEDAGHNVHKLQIVSYAFADYSWSSKAKGKIGVYIMADSLVSVADLASDGTMFKYGYFIIRGDLGRTRMDSREDFNNNSIGRDSDCNSACDKLAGKTYPQMNEIVKNKCHVVFGTTPEEGAKELLKAMGGEFNEEKSSKESSSSSLKESLKKAVSGWDGDVSINCIGDTVYVGKIPSPTNAILAINEFENVLYDSITVTDVNPSTINHLICTYKDYELVIKDDVLIKRFGKISQSIKCDSTIKTLKEAEEFIQREFNKIRRDDGRQVEVKVMGDTKWRKGSWVKTFLPSYFIDDYMWISKCAHDEDGSNNWNASLTLVDYPPSFGTFNEKENNEEDENSLEEST